MSREQERLERLGYSFQLIPTAMSWDKPTMKTYTVLVIHDGKLIKRTGPTTSQKEAIREGVRIAQKHERAQTADPAAGDETKKLGPEFPLDP
jgi:hypothetical protein